MLMTLRALRVGLTPCAGILEYTRKKSGVPERGCVELTMSAPPDGRTLRYGQAALKLIDLLDKHRGLIFTQKHENACSPQSYREKLESI